VTFSSSARSGLPPELTVAIIGAGPAGIGVARVLRDLAVPGVALLERKEIGASFKLWPSGMRFITPSFPSNAFGLTDLNALHFESSPGHLLKREHLSGPEYAAYLEDIVETQKLDCITGVELLAIEPEGEGFHLHTNQGSLRTRFVVWAAGEFQYPDLSLPGAEHGIHASQVKDWADYPGEDVIIIGGHESGVDAAIRLAAHGKKVTLLGRCASWSAQADDCDDHSLSPLTAQRLHAALSQKQPIELVGDCDIVRLDRMGENVKVSAADGRVWAARGFPVLATGFCGSSSLITRWLDKDARGLPILTHADESTVLSGLFLAGPEICHQAQRLRFIYQFRQRFAVVGGAIAERLGLDTRPLQAYRARNMFLETGHIG